MPRGSESAWADLIFCLVGEEPRALKSALLALQSEVVRSTLLRLSSWRALREISRFSKLSVALDSKIKNFFESGDVFV